MVNVSSAKRSTDAKRRLANNFIFYFLVFTNSIAYFLNIYHVVSMTIFDSYFTLPPRAKGYIKDAPKLFFEKKIDTSLGKSESWLKDLIFSFHPPYDFFSFSCFIYEHPHISFFKKETLEDSSILKLTVEHFLPVKRLTVLVALNIDYMKENIEIEFLDSLDEEDRDQIQRLTLTVFTYLCYLQSADTTGYTYVAKKEKIKVDQDKIFTRPQLSVIVLKSEKKRYEAPDQVKNIKWDYSFPVRGHWRLIDGLGKDPHGNRNQPGRTWVTPHIRGEGEVSNHLRVYK